MKTTPGQYLNEVRERLNISVRDVQEASAVIASEEGQRGFYISPGHLSRIENGSSIPSSFKLFALCAVYGLDFHDALRRYGIDGNRTRLYRDRFLPAVTRPASSEIYGFDEKVWVPVRLDPSFRWETTQLVNRIVALWGEIPASFLVGCNPRRHTYGFVGLADKTMLPLIRPGSLIMIDPERRRIIDQPYQNEFERPIYFVELRDGYRCAWCQIAGSKLLLIPHPISGLPVQTFNLPTDAGIVGQVVGVAMRLVPADVTNEERASKLLARSGVVK
ncbi:MAG TPA: helix-turn-helix transcriptional regulator [Candidatus Acidoferrales bacterium]|nr:helix-turn-helix transcriptional regulator [Candidatus Acidoferrales bacterium]